MRSPYKSLLTFIIVFLLMIFFVPYSYSFEDNAPIEKERLERFKKSYLVQIKQKMIKRINRIERLQLSNGVQYCSEYQIAFKNHQTISLCQFMRNSLDEFETFMGSSFTIGELKQALEKVKLFHLITKKALYDFGTLKGALIAKERIISFYGTKVPKQYLKILSIADYLLNLFKKNGNLFHLNKALASFRFDDGSSINIAKLKQHFLANTYFFLGCNNKKPTSLCSASKKHFVKKLNLLSDEKKVTIGAIFYFLNKYNTDVGLN